MTNFLIFLVIFSVATIFFKLLFSIFYEKGKYEKRLKKYVDIPPKEKIIKSNALNQPSFLKQISKAIESMINLTKNERLLSQSGVKLSLGELFIARVVLTFIGFLVAYMYELHFLLICIVGFIGFHLPILYVKNKRKRRLLMASKQLGEALGTMANSLRAGFSFMQTMNMVGKEIEEPLGPEFVKVIQEINYGISVEDAFKHMLVRLPDKELEIVLNTLIIQRTSGGNLALLLDTMQETIFDRSRVKDEVKALTAQGKLSAVIITLLPMALAMYIRFINPEYFNMLFSHPLGWAMLIGSAVSIILGWFFISKIVEIEV